MRRFMFSFLIKKIVEFSSVRFCCCFWIFPSVYTREFFLYLSDFWRLFLLIRYLEGKKNWNEILFISIWPLQIISEWWENLGDTRNDSEVLNFAINCGLYAYCAVHCAYFKCFCSGSGLTSVKPLWIFENWFKCCASVVNMAGMWAMTISCA